MLSLLILIFVTEKSLPTSSQNVFTPYGPRMCEVRCKTREGCSGVIFDEIKLSCQLILNTSNGLLTSSHSTDLGSNLCDDNNQSKLKGEKVDLRKGPLCSSDVVNRFHEACGKGDLSEVKRLLCRGLVGVNCRGKYGYTAAMVAVENEHEHILDFLLQQKCDLSPVDDRNNWSVLHLACDDGNTNTVTKLLDMPIIDIERKGLLGDTPLLVAVEEGHIPVVKLLTQKGADVKAVNNENNNMLQVACWGGYVKMVEYTLSLKIFDIEGTGQFGETPLLVAAEEGYIPIVKLLIRKGADVKAIDNKNNAMLHVACQRCHVKMVEYLLSLKIFDIERKGQRGRTPLMFAVGCGQMATVRLLRQHKAKLTTSDDFGFNLLHRACERGDLAMVKYLCTFEELKRLDLRKDKKGRTPFALAQLKGHNDIMSFLKSMH